MSLPSTIDVAFAQQYSSMLYILSQQKKSKFAPRVRNEVIRGAKDGYYDRLGEAEVEDISTRHPDTPINEIPNSRRRVTMTDSHTNALIDHQDQLKMLINPQNPYAQVQGAALGRKIDDKIITAALGAANAGVDGTTSVEFKDESVSINGDGTVTTLGTLASVGTIVDMSLAKILTMKRLYDDEDVDPDIPLYWAVSPKDVEDMLNITEIGSADYNTVKALAAGNVETFSGFEFFKSTRLTADAATSTGRRTISWAMDGLLFASADSITSKIDEREDKSYAVQVYSRMSNGAVRMDGDKVHECLNKIA
jgi:hypothetical protein